MAGRKGAGRRKEARRGVSLAWVCVLVVAAVCITGGVCAVYLPDRTPELLQKAEEVTSAPVETQDWSESRQVSFLPAFSAERTVTSNSSGMVTADWSGNGLHSGGAAFAVEGRPVIVLATSIPLWRDLHYYDTGEDVRALNNELARLGYPSDNGSATYSWNTGNAWARMLAACGAAAPGDGSFALSDTLWVPEDNVTVSGWTATPGTQISAGTPLASIPGRLTRLALNGAATAGIDRTAIIYGQSTTLPAGASTIDDQAFLDAVSATPDWRSQDQSALAAGVAGRLTTGETLHVLRVPAAAVYGLDETGVSGCIVADDNSVHVNVVGAEMGVSLVSATDGTDIDSIQRVTVGSALGGMTCE